jgi:hypothetical protein
MLKKIHFRWRYGLYGLLGLIVLLLACGFFLAQKPVPEQITYGMSFTTSYASELGLNWKEVYDAYLDDLQIRHLRLSAHWPMVEPTEGEFNFAELDYQIARAEGVGAEVILAVGRRLPRWPECHVPPWAKVLSREAHRMALLTYVEAVVERYKGSPAVTTWQIENEPFLRVFAFEHCGELDTELLDQEIALVRRLDPARPILVTDSGNLGTWQGAYQRGDRFGTSVYVYFWNPELGQFKTVLPPVSYRVKEGLVRHWYGRKDTLLIELSAEPWLIRPVVDTPVSVQLSRMDVHKFNDILAYARATRYDQQYLWGGEWWYWLKTKHGHGEMWERGRLLYRGERITSS